MENKNKELTISKQAKDLALLKESTDLKDKSLVLDKDIDVVKSNFEYMKKYAELVKKQMEPNVDYGVIIAGNKPVLLKPGMEKVLLSYGLFADTKILTEKIELNEKFVFYKVKAKLVAANGKVISTGYGSCNNREKAKIGMNFYDSINSVMKIAIKRAKMDATLGIGAFSGVFTQDLEDKVLGEKKASPTFSVSASKNHALKFYSECYKYFYGATRRFNEEEKAKVKPIINKAISDFKVEFKKPEFLIQKNRTHEDLDNIFNIFKFLTEKEKQIETRKKAAENGIIKTMISQIPDRPKVQPPSAEELLLERQIKDLEKRIAEDKAKENK